MLANRRVSVLGLAIKKDTDDVREATSLRVIDRLVKKGAKVCAYDPMATQNAQEVFHDHVEFVEDYKSCLAGADCCILITESDEFRKLRTRRTQIDYELA